MRIVPSEHMPCASSSECNAGLLDSHGFNALVRLTEWAIVRVVMLLLSHVGNIPSNLSVCVREKELSPHISVDRPEIVDGFGSSEVGKLNILKLPSRFG